MKVARAELRRLADALLLVLETNGLPTAYRFQLRALLSDIEFAQRASSAEWFELELPDLTGGDPALRESASGKRLRV